VIGYIASRLRWSLLVVATVCGLAFVLTFIAPADPAKSIAGPRAPAEAVERIRVALGLDRPMLDQLLAYVGRLVQGDLGNSYRQGGRPVLDLILGRMPATILLAVAGLAVALLVGIPLGIMAAQRPGGKLDHLMSGVGSVLLALPTFLVGLVVIYVVAFRLSLVPLPGRYDVLDLRALVLPALVLGLSACPVYLRLTRASMLDELHQDYVRTAHAKGLPPRSVTWRHAFRNTLTPLTTQAGLDMGFFLGGVVLVEAVFDWPGIGQQAVRAITSEDIPILMGTLLFATLCIVFANLVADILIALFDPRVRTW
jgi:peptide/nickel transport system permease protein